MGDKWRQEVLCFIQMKSRSVFLKLSLSVLVKNVKYNTSGAVWLERWKIER